MTCYIVFVSLIDIFMFLTQIQTNKVDFLFCRVVSGQTGWTPLTPFFFKRKKLEAFGHSAVSPVRFQGWEGSRLMGLLLAG